MREAFTIREENIPELAEKVLGLLSRTRNEKAKVLLLDGDLGAGKTTFTKALAELLGVPATKVSSPTFILKKEYNTEHSSFKKLIHVDAYRFNTPDEAKVLRLSDDMEASDTLIAIEWPTKMKRCKADVELIFSIVDDETRDVEIVHNGINI